MIILLHQNFGANLWGGYGRQLPPMGGEGRLNVGVKYISYFFMSLSGEEQSHKSFNSANKMLSFRIKVKI